MTLGPVMSRIPIVPRKRSVDVIQLSLPENTLTAIGLFIVYKASYKVKYTNIIKIII